MGRRIFDTFVFAMQSPFVCHSKDLDLYLRVVAEMRSDGYFIHEFMSPGIIAHVVREGRGVIELGGRSFEAGAGSMFIFWPDEHAKYYDFPDSPWRYTWFWLAGTKAQLLLDMAGMAPGNPVYSTEDLTGFLEAEDEVFNVFLKGGYSQLYPVHAAWRIADALFADTDGKREFVEDIATKCRLLIENGILPEMTVDKLSERLGVSRSNLFRAFKAEFGTSPKNYIDKIRFEKACQLLASGTMRIKDVAESCGYDNQCYFSNAFEKRFGLPPSKWRQSALAEKAKGG